MKKPYGTYPAEIAAPYIAEWEGMKCEAYQDAIGIWTIGCGHTKNVKPGDVVTRAEAMMMLVDDLKETIDGLAPHVKVNVTEGQFVALTSLAFNIGVEGLVGGCPKLMAALNAGDMKRCAKEFLDVDHAGGQCLPGLTRRRREEAELFMGERPMLEPYQNRVLQERDELKERLEKLQCFLKRPELKKTLETQLLKRQALFMRWYLETLNGRIKLWGGEGCSSSTRKSS